jgi:putative addiction module component (TIGR02574 family)
MAVGLRRLHVNAEVQGIFGQALGLPAADRARLVEVLLAGLDRPDEAIDALRRAEVEDRIAAFRSGRLRALSLDQVLAKYQK